MTMIVRLAINAVALLAVAYLLDGVEVAGFGAALIAALLLAVVNVTLRPLLLLLTIPINLVTLGLFTFVINAAMLLLVANLVGGFSIAGFGSALMAALLLSVVSWALNGLAGTRRRRYRR
jgi:putative membrane protein